MIGIRITLQDGRQLYEEDISAAEKALLKFKSHEVTGVHEVKYMRGKPDKVLHTIIAIWDFNGYGDVQLNRHENRPVRSNNEQSCS